LVQKEIQESWNNVKDKEQDRQKIRRSLGICLQAFEDELWVIEELQAQYALSKIYEDRRKFGFAKNFMQSVSQSRRKLQQITKKSVLIEEMGWGHGSGFRPKWSEDVVTFETSEELARSCSRKEGQRKYFYIKVLLK
jgi:predicted AAA+ superfamily ATPase